MMKTAIKAITLVTTFVIGVAAGALTTKKKIKYAGILRIDNSEHNDSEGLFLELHKDLSAIEKAKVINLKVIRKNWIQGE